METKEIESAITESARGSNEVKALKKVQAKETVVVVTKKGQTTIPVKLRKKYNIEEGTKLEVTDTGEGILLKRKKGFWDMAGAYAGDVDIEEVRAELYRMRHEVDPDEQSYL